MPKWNRAALDARLRSWFPEREFFMRSEGQVRFIRISSALQKRVAAGFALLALAWIVTMAWAAASSALSLWRHDDLLSREAKVASAESRVAAYRSNIARVG